LGGELKLVIKGVILFLFVLLVESMLTFLNKNKHYYLNLMVLKFRAKVLKY